LISALVFALAGMLLPALWFAPVLVRAHGDQVSWLLYVGLPGVAAALAGGLLGSPLVVPTARGRDGAAMLRGAIIATAALVFFAPLYAGVVKWTAPGRTSVLGLTLLVLGFGALARWWAVARVGGLVGWVLYRWSLRRLRAAA
jgi:hypothetical protein